MFVSKSHFDREVTFWRDRCDALEKRGADELTRHLAREDALLNRVLLKNQAPPVTQEELEPYEPPPPPVESAELGDVRRQFDEWADDAGVNDYERRRQWEIHKEQYAAEIG